MIICPKCNHENSSDTTFCKFCGENLGINVKRRVIAARHQAKKTKAIYVVFLVIGALFALGGVFLLTLAILNEPLWIPYPIILILCGGLSLHAGLSGLVRIKINNVNSAECIAYNFETHMLEATTYDGKKIIVDLDNYGGFKDNITTDNQLIFYYFDEKQKRRRANLGYCQNKNDIKRALVEISGKQIDSNI